MTANGLIDRLFRQERWSEVECTARLGELIATTDARYTWEAERCVAHRVALHVLAYNFAAVDARFASATNVAYWHIATPINVG